MSVWKLKPIDTSAELWNESLFIGAVYIEAQNELQARQFAYKRYCGQNNSSQQNPGTWLSKDIVICQKIDADGDNDHDNNTNSEKVLVLIEVPYSSHV